MPPRAKFVFHNLLFFIEWNVKKLFSKTNLNLKVVKLNKTLININLVYKLPYGLFKNTLSNYVSRLRNEDASEVVFFNRVLKVYPYFRK